MGYLGITLAGDFNNIAEPVAQHPWSRRTIFLYTQLTQALLYRCLVLAALGCSMEQDVPNPDTVCK